MNGIFKLRIGALVYHRIREYFTLQLLFLWVPPKIHADMSHILHCKSDSAEKEDETMAPGQLLKKDTLLLKVRMKTKYFAIAPVGLCASSKRPTKVAPSGAAKRKVVFCSSARSHKSMQYYAIFTTLVDFGAQVSFTSSLRCEERRSCGRLIVVEGCCLFRPNEVVLIGKFLLL